MVNKKIDVIILAAGNIKNKLHFSNFIFDSPALIPINVRTVISYLLDFYIKQDVNIHIVINYCDKETIENEIQYYKNINLIFLENTLNVVDSLTQACLAIKVLDDVIINVATTIPTRIANQNSALISDNLTLNADWSGIIVDKNINFIYKRNMNKKESYAFTGIFRCNYKYLKNSLQINQNENDLLKIVESIYNLKKIAFEYTDWIDCGHELNFYDAKAKLISSRSFNAIKIEPIVGVITKSSKNIKKFSDEIRYIQLLPKEISIFFPRILGDIQINEDYASTQMEYYGYSTVAEYMLYWNLEDYIWDKIFNSLNIVLKNFKEYKYSIGKKAHYEFYCSKTFDRLEEFKIQMTPTNNIFKDVIFVNGYKCKSMDLLKDKIRAKIDYLYLEDDFSIMHGDLCFNNILFDIKSGIIRLIDARGSFGESCIGIYGDIKYDLAKLTHSVIGRYDFIVNNLFSLEFHENNYTYSILNRENYNFLCSLNEKIIVNLGYKMKDILFLIGLLFVSMCPLHNDDINRQIIMYVHGLKYLNESLGE